MTAKDTATAAAPVPPASCMVCGATRGLAHQFTVRGYHLWRCGACHLRWVHPRPSEGTGEIYDAAYFRGEKEGMGYENYLDDDHWYGPMVYEQMRERLVGLFPQRGRLLDLGCAAGHLVEAAVADGWDATGVDPGDYVVAAGRERGLDLRSSTLRDAALPEEHFDVITAFHTIEHLPEPVEDLIELRRIAKPGALLAIEVPNGSSLGAMLRRERWSQMRPPEHINFFGHRALGRLLERTGWRPTDWHTRDFGAVCSAQIVSAGRGTLATKAAGLAGRTVETLGIWKAVRALGRGGNLRMFATTAERRKDGS